MGGKKCATRRTPQPYVVFSFPHRPVDGGPEHVHPVGLHRDPQSLPELAVVETPLEHPVDDVLLPGVDVAPVQVVLGSSQLAFARVAVDALG